jgi:aminopeptidase N
MPTEEKFLKDYISPFYTIDSCNLTFTITDSFTQVDNFLTFHKNTDSNEDLVLDGVDLELLKIVLDGKELENDTYSITEESLILKDLPNSFNLLIVTKIFPEKNTALEWLYKSAGIYCTQNEPEGFRKITYFLDRPDCMTIFTTKIIASKQYPILLSNGNLIESGDIDNETHYTVWNDPFKKPSYLFALVAGDLGKISDTFTTMSGKVVDLHIFSEHGNEKKCLHAMESLKKSMKWDEEVYGREYDLDVFHIVAVDSFNMGAMENKSLNVFNTIYVLVDIETATDRDFLGVESVIGHEYFHNWTGNRITCKNWFQLTLKEGLTVFRDHDFSGDMNSRDTMRIEDIRDLREFQFGEDAGPTAHPIQPASYKEMNNFYTATVYEKGSEVIRMMATLLGKEKFRKAMDLYFETFDGQAVTTQDFVWAMATAGNIDLTQFEETWYHQERTPGLRVRGVYTPQNSTYTLYCEQIIDKNTKGEEQKPFFYPLRVALFGLDGVQFPLVLNTESNQSRISDGVLIISKTSESFVFENITNEPKISLNRGFSAPIKVFFDDLDSRFLVQNETDGFARFEAMEQYTSTVFQGIINGKWVPEEYLALYGSLLEKVEDSLYQSILIKIPTLNTLAGMYSGPIDFEVLSGARKTLLEVILSQYEEKIIQLYHELISLLPEDEWITAYEIGVRSYINSLLEILSYSKNSEDMIRIAESQYQNSKTMTLQLSALILLDQYNEEERHPFLQKFIDTYQNNPLVIMKYLTLVGNSNHPRVIENIRKVQKESLYQENLPNHAKALFGTFSRNLEFFHKKDGSGYELLTDFILDIDTINPHTAARMAGAFKLYPKLSTECQGIMRPYLEKIYKREWLSKNTEEIIDKILHYKG